MIAICTPVASLGHTWIKRFDVWLCKKEILTILCCTYHVSICCLESNNCKEKIGSDNPRKNGA